MTLLAWLIAKEEGFGLPGKIPTERRNPGDLRHSPHSSHVGVSPDDIGIIDTVTHGWEDLERQLSIDASRGMTLAQLVYSWAPPNENDSARYLTNVLRGFGGVILPTTPLTEVLKIKYRGQ